MEIARQPSDSSSTSLEIGAALASTPQSNADLTSIFPGDSEMARCMRDADWSVTAAGDPRRWPAEWRFSLRLCLTSRIPVVMYMVPEFAVLYNDPYISFLGPGKHPRFLGAPASECWREIWPIIGPMLQGVVDTGHATWSEDLELHFARRLPLEEVYIRFTFGPILADDGKTVLGFFCTCTETTERVIGERRLETLRRLGLRGPEARTVEATARDAVAVLADNTHDLRFAALYVADEAGEIATLHGTTGLGSEPLPASVRLGDEAAIARLLEQVSGHAADSHQALPLIVPGATHDRPGGVLCVGVSPYLVLDDAYRNFLLMVARNIG